jgi:NAD(P)-dependent dehydrogenase (short-subunit alcohol dehydrogenase family)
MTTIDLSERRVLIPGGTGSVGEGIVRQFLAAGAQVVVPTRTEARAEEFRRVLGPTASDRLHLFVHDYTTFAGAEDLAAQTFHRLGGLDDVVAPIGGWWGGKRLWEIEEADWQAAFVSLASTQMGVMRAALPFLPQPGAYSIVIGASAFIPIPGSGLVSMEQAALLMMRQVLDAELEGSKRVFALTLGPVRSRASAGGDPDQVSADQVGEVAVAIAGSTAPGREVRLRNQAEFLDAMAGLRPAAEVRS